MKLLLFTIQYPPHVGGVPTFYYYFTNFFSPEEIVVLTAKEMGWEKIDKKLRFPVFRTSVLNNYRKEKGFALMASNIFIFLYLIKTVLKAGISSIIIGHSNLAFLCMGFIVRVFLKKNYFIFSHGDAEAPQIKQKSDFIRKKIFKNASGMIVNSNFTKNRLIKKYGVESNKIQILNPGVDTVKFRPLTDTNGLRQEMHLDNKKIILTVGRLDKRKGHDMVLKALPTVLSKFNNVMYLIVGGGKEREGLEKIIRENSLERYVNFIGKIAEDDLPKFYNLCDIFIMPNRELEDGDSEGFGIVFMEANACGKAVIGGKSGGAVEAIENGVTGLLVDPYNVEDIAQKIIYLLTNKTKAEQMGILGRKRAVEKFDWENAVKTNFEKIRKTLWKAGIR